MLGSTLGQSWSKTSLALVALLPICFSQSRTSQKLSAGQHFQYRNHHWGKFSSFQVFKFSSFQLYHHWGKLLVWFPSRICQGSAKAILTKKDKTVLTKKDKTGVVLNSKERQDRGLFWKHENLRVKSAARCFLPSPTTTTLLKTLIWQLDQY